MAQARGVLPHRNDKVMANPLATGVIATVTLRGDIDAAGVQTWLDTVEQAIAVLRTPDNDGNRLATVATGFSPSFFTRIGMTPPVGFSRLPAVPFGSPITSDVVFYVVSLSEAVTARFLHTLSSTRPDITAIHIERGYQRLDETEPFGYKDGLRNVVPKTDRHRTVFVNADRHADEPAYAIDGTYMAYMRISQNLDAFAKLDPTAQDRTIGRTRDGNRLDLPPGTDPKTEPEITSDACPVSSHVRKTGPRGTGNDTVDIFRRGLPFQEINADGTLTAGLQFVSFQASLDQFDVVFNRWMLNPNFPTPGAGHDALIAQGLISIEKHGFYFVPAETDGSIATTLSKERGKPTKTKTGRIAIRKRLIDAGTGQPSLLDLHGFQFQVTTPDGTPVGSVFTTDAAGHALSDEIDAGDYLVTELPPPAPVTADAPKPVALHSARAVVEMVNTVPTGTTGYQ
jgi:deferrochelatase/peroxidase EfeB